jgi:restriction system protein
MGRRSGFLAVMQQIAREQARIQRQAEAARRHLEAAQRRQVREQLRNEREALRLQKDLDRQQKQQYAENRAVEANDQNQELVERMDALAGILTATLEVDDTIAFDSLRMKEEVAPFTPPRDLIEVRPAPNRENYTMIVRPLGLFERLLGIRSRYEREMAEAERRYADALLSHEASETNRTETLQALRIEHERRISAKLAEIRQRNQEVDELERSYRTGEPGAIIAYCSMVLERSQYPDGFPQQFRIAFVPESKELVVDYELPTVEIVPATAEHRYVKARDLIEAKPRKPAEIKEAYQDIVAAVALRTIHEVFEADQGNHIGIVVFNGFVSTVDPATGKDTRPYLISVRATEERFLEIDLARVEKSACLRNLGAQVSPRPAELLAVKPLIEFDMVDKRFVEGGDVLSELESRPNLMDLNPFEFETLVTNLFSRMGLETKQTRSAKDGGVDAVAFDTRPIIGGKVVVQAKRYRHTVGVSAVRDLFGTMNHEGANKGILVTTSSFGPDAYDFIKGKPIELIDGGGLLYYLEQHGVKARILFPEEGAIGDR